MTRSKKAQTELIMKLVNISFTYDFLLVQIPSKPQSIETKPCVITVMDRYSEKIHVRSCSKNGYSLWKKQT